MKKIISMLLVLAVFVFPLCEAKIATSYKHTDDSYAVTFDGEGDAIVSASLQIDNVQEKNFIGKLTLKFPKQIILYSAVQEHKGQSIRIKKDELTESVSTLEIYLPSMIMPGEQSTIILTYKIPRYAHKNLFSTFKFDFESIIDKNADIIENVRVSINVIPELYMKGTGSQVHYKPDLSAYKMQSEVALAAESYSVPAYVNVIKSSGGYVKTTTYLDPGESFHVKGKYASSKYALNIGKIIIALLIMVLFVYGVIKGIKLLKNMPIKEPKIKKSKITPFSEAIIVGVCFSALLTAVLFLSNYVMKFLMDNFQYDIEFVLGLLLILTIILNIALFIVPSIYIGHKNKSFLFGLVTFISTVFSLMIILVLIVFITKGNVKLFNFF